jgi:outer membrane immunogenic protein
MKKFLPGCAALFFLSAGAPALATDMPIKAPVYQAPAPFSWSGIYVGAHLGYGWGDFDVVDANIAPMQTTSLRPSGWFGGGQIGYNVQFASRWVLGLEIDISGSNLRDSGFTSPGNIAASGKVDYFGTVRTRLGYAMDRTLLYATGGLAWAHDKFDETTGSMNHDEYHSGWTIGAGLEYAFAPGWSAKIEYLYADLGRNREIVNDVSRFRTMDLTLNTVRVGINYRFGDPASAQSPARMPVKAAYAPASIWNGSYLGLHGGYAWASHDVFNGSFIVPETSKLDPKGWFGGFQSGYNWRFAPTWVFGLEADTSFGRVRDSGLSSPSSRTVSAKIDDLSTARARLGYAVDRTLVYGTGGLAVAHDKYSEFAGATGIMRPDRYHVGWTVGGGIEYAFDPMWSAKIEYLYADLGRDKEVIAGINRTVDLTMSTVKVGLNYQGSVLERLFGGR